MRTLRAARLPCPPVVIVVTQGNDSRFTYCPRHAVDMLNVRQLPGNFDTVEQAIEAVKRDTTIPTGARVELDEPFMVRS